MNIRLQTIGSSSIEVLKSGLSDLAETANVLLFFVVIVIVAVVVVIVVVDVVVPLKF